MLVFGLGTKSEAARLVCDALTGPNQLRSIIKAVRDAEYEDCCRVVM